MDVILYHIYVFYDKIIYHKYITSSFMREGLDVNAIAVFAISTSIIFINIPFNILYRICFNDFSIEYNVAIVFLYVLYCEYKYSYKKELDIIIENKPLFFNSEIISRIITILYVLLGFSILIFHNAYPHVFPR